MQILVFKIQSVETIVIVYCCAATTHHARRCACNLLSYKKTLEPHKHTRAVTAALSLNFTDLTSHQ